MEFIKQITYVPLYNFFALVLNIPHIDAGVAVIVFTLAIRFLLYPLTKKALMSQIKIQQIQPKLKELQEKHKDNKEVLARETLALYRDNKVNPFATILVVLIQIPILISLYYIFSSGALTELNARLLYSFIPTPVSPGHMFLNIIDLAVRSIPLAFAAAVTQHIVARIQQQFLLASRNKAISKGEKPSMQDDIARTMSVQMTYVLPVIVFIASISLPAVLGLYWTVSNIFSIFQELSLKKHRKVLLD